MRKKKFIACFLVVLVLAVSAVTLVACKDKNPSIDFPNVPPTSSVETPGVGDLLLTMLKGMGTTDEYVSMNFESDITTFNGGVADKRKFYLKGNFKPNAETGISSVELGLGVLCEKDPTQDFEIFLKDGRFYMKVAERLLYLQDVDFRWIIQQLSKIDGLQDLVNTIMGLLPIDIPSTDVDELIGLVAMLIFQVDTGATTYVPAIPPEGTPESEKAKYLQKGTGHISLKLNPDQLIGTVVGALGGLSIDSVLNDFGFALKLPNSEGNFEVVSIDAFLKTLAFPNVDVYVEADVENGNIIMGDMENGRRGLKMHIYDYAGEYFQMSTDSGFTNEAIEFLPSNLKEYMPFNLLKLQFNTTFNLDIDRLDVGKLVNYFTGKKDFLPADSLILSASAGLTVEIDADIRMKENEDGTDGSLLSIEIYGDDKEEPMIGIYLMDTILYIDLDNVLSAQSPDKEFDVAVCPGKIKFEGINLANWISEGINYVKDIVDGLLDSIFPPKSDTANAKSRSTFGLVSDDIEFRDGYSSDDIVLAVGNGKNGAYISDAFGTILDVIRYTTAFEKFLTYDKEEGIINFKVNHEFLQQLNEQFKLRIPELENMKDFGSADIGINLKDKNVYLGLDVHAPEGEDGFGRFKADIKLDQFEYGFSRHDQLKKKISDIVNKEDSKPYVNNLVDLIKSAMNDIDLEFRGALEIDPGVYSLDKIFGIKTGLPAVKVEVANGFVMDLTLKVQIQMGNIEVPEVDANGKRTGNMKTEKIIARARISIMNKYANPIFPKNDMEINLYYFDYRYEGNKNIQKPQSEKSVNGVLFADMSQFNMIKIGIPSFAIGIDLTEMLFGEIENIQFDFQTILDMIKGNGDGEDSGNSGETAKVRARRNSSADAESELISALFNPETNAMARRGLNLHVTTEIINAIMQQFGLDIGFELPYVELDFVIDSIDGIKLTIGAFREVEDGDPAKVIGLELEIKKFKIGSPFDRDIDTTDFEEDYKNNPSKYGAFINIADVIPSDGNNSGSKIDDNIVDSIVQGLVYRALDDVDIKLNFEFTLDAGIYHTNYIFGFETGLPDIPIILDKKTTIKFSISIQVESEIVPKVDVRGNVIKDANGNVAEYEQIISRAIITLQNESPNPITPKGNGAVRIIYIDDRSEANAEYFKNGKIAKYSVVEGKDSRGNTTYKQTKSHGTLFLNLSTFNLLKFELPDVALDIDLNKIVDQLIKDGNIDLSDVVFGDQEEAISRNGSLSLVADEVEEEKTTTFVELAFTKEVINELLAMFNVNLDFSLPDLDGALKISVENGIEIKITLTDNDFDSPDGEKKDKEVNAILGLNKLLLGATFAEEDMDENNHLRLPKIGVGEDAKDFDPADFGSPSALSNINALLKSVIYRALDDVDFMFDIALTVKGGTYYIDELIGSFVDLNLGRIPIEIKEDLKLHLTIRVQIRWNKFVNSSGIGAGEFGITQAKISIYNKYDNILLGGGWCKGEYENYDKPGVPAGAQPALSIVYIDERGANNSYATFKKGENGKKTYGTLYVDFSNFELAKLKLPNMAFDIDLTELLTGIIEGINIDTGNGNNNDGGNDDSGIEQALTRYLTQNLTTVADGESEEEESKDNFLQVQIVMSLIESVLEHFGIPVEIPDLLDSVNGDFTISEINGIKLHVGLKNGGEDNVVEFDLAIVHLVLGKETKIFGENNSPVDNGFSKDNFGVKCIGSYYTNNKEGKFDIDIASIVHRALSNVNLELRLTATLPDGTYDLAGILRALGVELEEDAHININVTDPFKLDLALRIQLEMGMDNRGNEIVSRGKIELVSYAPNLIMDGSDEGVAIISMYYFDDRIRDNDSFELVKKGEKDSNGIVKKSNGTAFVKFDGIKIANIQLPAVKLDIDLTQIIDFALKEIAGNGGNGSTASFSAASASTFGLACVSANDGNTEEDPNLKNYIYVTVTTQLLDKVFELIGVDLGGIELPNFTVNVGAFVESGISVILNIEDVLGVEGKNLDAMLSFPKLGIGVSDIVDIRGFEKSDYKTDFSEMISNLIRYGEITGHLNVSANSSTINVQRLLNNILSTSGMIINMPISIDLNDFANVIDFRLKWEFDYKNPKNTKILLEFKCDGAMIMSLYALGDRNSTNCNVYIDMTGLGLPKFAIVDSRIANKLSTMITEGLNGVLSGLVDTITSIGGGSGNNGGSNAEDPAEDEVAESLQQKVARANNMTASEMNSKLFEKALAGELEGEEDEKGLMHYIGLLLKGLAIDDGVIKAEIAADVMRDILMAASINIAEDVALKLELNLFEGTLDLHAQFDEVFLGARIEIKNIGKAHEDFDEDFAIVKDNVDSYPKLNASTGDMFITSLFNTLQPGLWIDLISTNDATPSSVNFTYAKITMAKAPAEGLSLPDTNDGRANGGSLVLALRRLDGSSRPDDGIGQVAIYIIIDINAGNMVIRGSSNLLPKIAGINIDQYVNIAIPLDIKGLLGGLFGGIIDEINKDGLPKTTPTGDLELNKIFGELSIDSIISGVNIKLYGIKNIKINVKLNHDTINALVPRLINEGLNGMSISLNPKKENYHRIRGLNYNANGNNSGFVDNLWNNLILEVVVLALKDEGVSLSGGLIDFVAGGIRDNVKNLVAHILPLPRFVELNANVYIINGKIDNIQVVGYGEKTDDMAKRQKLELMIFNPNNGFTDGGMGNNVSVLNGQVFFGKMEQGDLNNTEFQSPYVRFDIALDSEDYFKGKFVETAYRSNTAKIYYEIMQNGNAGRYVYTTEAVDVSWEITYFSRTYTDFSDLTIGNELDWFKSNYGKTGKDALKFSNANMGAFKNSSNGFIVGYYAATGTAIFNGTPYTTTVKIVIEDNKTFIEHSNTFVDNINVRAGKDLPEAITLTNDKWYNTSTMKYEVKSVYIKKDPNDTREKFVYSSNCWPGNDHDSNTEYEPKNTTITINFADGKSSKEKGVNVHWDPYQLTLDDKDKEVDISIFDYLDFYKNIYMSNRILVKTPDGRRIFQDVQYVEITGGTAMFETEDKKLSITHPDGSVEEKTVKYPKLDDNGRPVLANIDGWKDGKGFTTILTYHFVNDRKIELTMEKTINIKPVEVDYVRFDTGKNTIILDSVEDEDALPTTVDVFFKKLGTETVARHQVFKIKPDSWSFDKFGIPGYYEGNTFKIEQDYDGAFDSGVATDVIGNINIVIENAYILYAKAGAENAENKTWTDISYYDFANRKFGDLDLRFVTSTGKTIDYIDRIHFVKGYYRVPEYKYEKDENGDDVIVKDEDGNPTYNWDTVRREKNDYAGRKNVYNYMANHISGIYRSRGITNLISTIPERSDSEVHYNEILSMIEEQYSKLNELVQKETNLDTRDNLVAAISDIQSEWSKWKVIENDYYKEYYSYDTEFVRFFGSPEKDFVTYDILDGGQTVGGEGGVAILTIRLYFLKANVDNEDLRLVNPNYKNNYKETYIYFNVAKPPIRID